MLIGAVVGLVLIYLNKVDRLKLGLVYLWFVLPLGYNMANDFPRYANSRQFLFIFATLAIDQAGGSKTKLGSPLPACCSPSRGSFPCSSCIHISTSTTTSSPVGWKAPSGSTNWITGRPRISTPEPTSTRTFRPAARSSQL